MAGHFGIDAERAVKSCGDGGDQFQNSSLKFAIVWVCCKSFCLSKSEVRHPN